MKITHVRAYYKAAPDPDVKAVDDVSLTIEEGEVVGIAGESGCGKSTLASVISLTTKPPLYLKGGTLELDGEVIQLTRELKAPDGWNGLKVALLPQRALNSLNPTARIAKFVVDVVRAHDRSIKPEQAIKMAQERLEFLQLPPRVLDSYPHQLSGGMRQRVVAVISTLLNPNLLIADEPTSALDVSSQKQLMLLLRQLLANGFIKRIAFITHDLPLLSNIADRIAVMYAGKFIEVGVTSQIVEHPRHPYTHALISSTLDPSPEVRHHRLEGIKGTPPDLRWPPAGCRFNPRCPLVMDICAREEPPVIGDENDFALCWWFQQQKEKRAAAGQLKEAEAK
ncbi:MAG: ABC transporter ATP-binding protein [Chloroflexi bacterium]|nr:ABC transporter ATP-binding protein [Chloroflexota bacterium]OJV90228.1 MAG: peptide ABC transporter ATP-binding protein [Chloroflexi bacterium 54-19]